MALLQLIDNKYQDIPLLTVMRSPIGGFDADDMIKSAPGPRPGPFIRLQRIMPKAMMMIWLTG